ncbi:MAG: ROK family protein [Pyrinomonadaceae bacterium]
MKPRLVCAFDLGGTNLRAAIIDDTGTIHSRVQHDTPRTAKSPDEIVRALVAAARECESRLSDYSAIQAASVVVPGIVDSSNKVVIQVPAIPCLDNFRLKDVLAKELGWPVVLENDANAAALGEMWLGAGRGYRTIICITLGTGVGGGIILDGKLWRGADGTAGEVGHTSVDPLGGVRCKCGSTGCLEMFASATAIVRLAREALPRHPHSILSGDGFSAKEVYDVGMKGDTLAAEVLERMGAFLGIGIANLVNLLNPEVIVIGGRVANAWQLFADHMHREVLARAFSLPAQNVRIVPAECGDDAGLLGAARLAFDELGGLNELPE